MHKQRPPEVLLADLRLWVLPIDSALEGLSSSDLKTENKTPEEPDSLYWSTTALSPWSRTLLSLKDNKGSNCWLSLSHSLRKRPAHRSAPARRTWTESTFRSLQRLSLCFYMTHTGYIYLEVSCHFKK